MHKLVNRFVQQIQTFRVSLGLQNTLDILSRLNNPHKKLKTIHIAGTNGKGSTIITLERLLIDSGFKVSTTISPHLVKINERFRLQGQAIDDQQLERLYFLLFEVCHIDEFNVEDPYQWQLRPSFFESHIIMFLLWSWQQKVDFCLLETGLGGRLDATNVVQSCAAALTAIDYDHQAVLGNNLRLITTEKMAIIKPTSIAVIARQQKQVLSTIKANFHDKPYYFGVDYGYHYKHDQSSYEFYIKYKNINSKNFSPKQHVVPLNSLNLLGTHQLDNCATAMCLYHLLVPSKLRLNKDMLAQSLRRVYWPGRLQFIDYRPPLLIDGAHNNQGFKSFIDYLQANFKGKKILVAIAWSKDKQLFDFCDQEFLQKIDFLPINFVHPRAQKIDSIIDKLHSLNLRVLEEKGLEKFIEGIIDNKFSDYQLIAVAGSLYVIGDFLKLWDKVQHPTATNT